MRELPIIFSGPMVHAILDGRKTMTRRKSGFGFVNEHPDWWKQAVRLCDGTWSLWTPAAPDLQELKSRYQVGDHLWVRETWQLVFACIDPETGYADDFYIWEGPIPDCLPVGWHIAYQSDFGDIYGHPDDRIIKRWRSPIYMPKWAARIWLEVTGVKCERVQDVPEEDILKEGITVALVAEWLKIPWESMPMLKDAFREVWNHLHGPGAWERNEWIFAYSFRRIEK